MESDSYPYEIRQKMIERAMPNFFKIQVGSLYYAMDQMNKQGLVETVEVVRDGKRPDKTIYRISVQGRNEFQKLLMEQFEKKNDFFHPMYPALAFSNYGDEDQIAEVLERSIIACEQHMVMMKAVYEEHIPTVPHGVLHLMWGSYEHARTELKWLKRLLRDARAKELKQIGVPLQMDDELY